MITNREQARKARDKEWGEQHGLELVKNLVQTYRSPEYPDVRVMHRSENFAVVYARVKGIYLELISRSDSTVLRTAKKVQAAADKLK